MRTEGIAKPDFEALFKSLPSLYILLDPNLRAVAVTDAYLQATMTRRDDILGRHILEVFRDNPDGPLADAIRNSSASFERVVKDRVADAMAVQRLEVRKPESEGGGYEVRYWSPVNSPILRADGSLEFIIHEIKNVTEFVWNEQGGERSERTFQTEADLYSRSREAAEISLKLKQVNEDLSGELAQRAGELHAILDAAPVAVWIAHDPQCLRITGNAYADRIVMQTERGGNVSRSAPPGDEAVTYRVFRDNVELRPEQLPAQVAAATGKPVKEEEFALVFADGRIVHMFMGAVPLYDAAGRLRGAVAAGIDITARKLAETERDRLFDYSLDILCVAGFDGYFKRVSPSFERILGWNEEDALSKTILEFIHPEDRESSRTAATSHEVGHKAISFENRYLTKDGAYRWISWNSHPIVEEGLIIGVGRDITEQKRAEEALRVSEERLRLFVEHAPAAIAMLDRQMRYVALSRRWLTDYQLGEQELIGRSHYEVFPEIPERWKEIHRRCLAGAVEKCDYDPFPRADGSVDLVRWEIRPWHNENGEIEGLIVFSEVVTERKRAEEALRASEDQFRTLANAIPQLCWMANGDGWIFWYNERWYEYTGTTPEQMEGWGWQSVNDPAVLPTVLDRWHASIESGQPFDMVFPLRGADGVFRPFLTRIMPVRDRDGKVTRWFGTNTDISEQRRIEEALSTSESRLRALLESASQGVVAVDETGHILLVNARTEELFGYKRDELIGQPVELLVPEQLHAVHAEHKRQYFEHPRTRPMGAGLDLRGRKKSGGDIAVEISLSFVEEGGKRLALALITDVSERKQAEERLRQAQKLESLGLLAGGVAHDFNNLLVGVIGNASLAQEMLPAEHPAVGLMERVLKTGEQAAHLTRQMLAYAGKGKFLVEPLNLSALIPDMCGLVRPSISKKIELQLDLEAGLLSIEADRGQVQQVFMNLTLNAAEAIGSEGVITVSTSVRNLDEPYIKLHPELSALAPGRYVCLEVRDTGSGMDEATKTKIFDPFFSTKFTGRGLGLAAVSGILRGHRSGITVSSAPGKGSRFTVLFPATTSAVVDDVPIDRGASLQGEGTVLVVDDERIVSELVKAVLERLGYTVLLANSGSEAIDVFKRHPGEIGLVILDLNMPNMSGEEALPELRKIRPNVKVVVSSGFSESEAMPLFEGQRVSGFVQKPYTAKKIAEKVKECIG